jgi:hypothetical protein
MERFLFHFVVVAGIGGGLCMAVWPRWVALKNRDEGDDRPLTVGDIWTMRVAGILLVAGSCYGLYALLTGMPGAEFGAP